MNKSPLGPSQTAWRFAAQKHQGQLYPGTDLPYLVHIGAVLLELVPALDETPELDNELAICCALLHDTLEDTDTSPKELEELFGAEVAAGVRALTKQASLAKEEAMRDSLSRIQAQGREVWLVKLSDRIANLGTPPPHWNREKCLAYAAEGEMILSALGAASARLTARLVSRISAWKNGR